MQDKGERKMENNEVKMATPNQINKLRELGYQGNPETLTLIQASVEINNLTKAQQGNNQGAYNGGYPRQPQQGYPSQGYQQPQQYQQPQRGQAPIVQVQQDYSIKTRTGEVLDLNPDVVNAYISPEVPLTPVEFNYFFSVCKTYELNPFLKDIYAIKFGNQPATFIIDYKVMQQAADNNPMFDGLKVGVLYLDANGQPKEREGAYILPGEVLIGGWCDVFRKDRNHTNRTYALYDENVKTTKDGKPNTNWATKPVFMCVKVAKAQALREAFPNMFSNNTYTTDEMPERDEDMIINQTVEEVNKKQEKKTASKKSTPVETNEWPE
jgi:phage recombination protein Bet